jgi:amino acid transporter
MAEERIFLRKASGVIRSWSPLDGWVYNVLAINPVIMIALSYVWAAWLYPAGDMLIAAVLCGIFCTAEAIVQAALNCSMPRSGGDYVFQSRLMSGFVGYVSAMTGIIIIEVVWLAIAGYFLATTVMSPFLVVLGNAWNNGTLIAGGLWLALPDGIWVASIITVVWCAVINVAGMIWYARLQRLLFWPGLVLMSVFMVILAMTPQTVAIGSFNSFMSSVFKMDNAAQSIVATASKLGWAPGGSFVSATIAMIPIFAFSLIYPNWGAAQAGEIKKATSFKLQLFQTAGCEVFSFVWGGLLAYLLVSTYGMNLLSALGFLFYSTPAQNPVPVPPFFGLLLSTLYPSPYLALLVMVAFNLWFWMWATNITLAMSRCIMAMSFDRMLPEHLADVSERTHTPVKAIVFISTFGLLASWAYAYTSFSTLVLSSALVSVICFALSVLAGGLMPYIRKQIWATSPAHDSTMIGGMSILTPLSFIFVGFTIWLSYVYLTIPDYGLVSPISWAFLGGIYVLSALLYFGFKWYRKRQGIDVSLAYRAIPYA